MTSYVATNFQRQRKVLNLEQIQLFSQLAVILSLTEYLYGKIHLSEQETTELGEDEGLRSRQM